MSLTEPNHRRPSLFTGRRRLKPRTTNPRSHSQKQIAQIATPSAFGFTIRSLVDDANASLPATAASKDAKAVGLDQVPTVRLSDLSEAEIRAYVIA